jgi:hypothetical protein
MKNKFNKLISKYGYKELFYIFLYPIFLPLLMLKDTTLSVYNIIKALLKYDWKYLSGNDQKNAYNNLFYYIQDFNIQKFGRYGKSNLLSDTNYSLKNLFHITPFSLRMQSSFGTTFIMFFAMCFWLISWIILYQDNSNLWLILGVVFFSTIFFATFVEIQNYNILGWMLYPIFLINIINDNYLILTIILFLISLSSFTAFFISSILLLSSFFYTFDYYLLLVLIPGGVIRTVPVVISIKEGALNKIFGGIGGYDKVKYCRKQAKKLNISKAYILILFIQFLFFYNLQNQFSIITLWLIVIVCLFIVNELIMRFADNQTFYLAYLSVSVASLLNVDFNLLIFISFVFSIYPIYGLIPNASAKDRSFISPGIRAPYNSKATIEGLSSLFSSVPKKSKLIMAYKNPQGQYNNIFNGYRVFNEPIHFSATINNMAFFPNWYTVFDNNKENDSVDFWIDNCDDAIKYMSKNNIYYIVIPSFIKNFNSNSFTEIGKFEFALDKNHFDINNYSIKLLKINKLLENNKK